MHLSWIIQLKDRWKYKFILDIWYLKNHFSYFNLWSANFGLIQMEQFWFPIFKKSKQRVEAVGSLQYSSLSRLHNRHRHFAKFVRNRQGGFIFSKNRQLEQCYLVMQNHIKIVSSQVTEFKHKVLLIHLMIWWLASSWNQKLI